MKETVLDVLMYLFESFVDSEDEPEPNRNQLRDELERAGFGDREIDGALEWLDALNASDVAPAASAPSAGMRIYDTAELERLDAKTRGYLLHLEQLGILLPAQRELAIDRLLKERPAFDGISVVGMPLASPGMGEPNGTPLDVLSFHNGQIAEYMSVTTF